MKLHPLLFGIVLALAPWVAPVLLSMRAALPGQPWYASTPVTPLLVASAIILTLQLTLWLLERRIGRLSADAN